MVRASSCQPHGDHAIEGHAMPEGPEVETERLHEAIHEELEKEGSSFLKHIALTTAILAALAAIASMRAGDTVNEALVLKTESARLQAQASDQWAYYQAKGIKAAIQRSTQSPWFASGHLPPPELEHAAARYVAEQDTIRGAAHKLEVERDAKSEEADALLRQHHTLAKAVALLQVAIALGAVAALTRQRLVWFASQVLGFGGAMLRARTFMPH
jgi:hypothetical protein